MYVQHLLIFDFVFVFFTTCIIIFGVLIANILVQPQIGEHFCQFKRLTFSSALDTHKPTPFMLASDRILLMASSSFVSLLMYALISAKSAWDQLNGMHRLDTAPYTPSSTHYRKNQFKRKEKVNV